MRGVEGLVLASRCPWRGRKGPSGGSVQLGRRGVAARGRRRQVHVGGSSGVGPVSQAWRHGSGRAGPERQKPGNDERPSRWGTAFRGGGRYWDRTSDLFRVREARYRCANRPGLICERTAQGGTAVLRGGDGIRTHVHGFAGRCLASRPLHQVEPDRSEDLSERTTGFEPATLTLAR